MLVVLFLVVQVGFEETGYTISEMKASVDICVTSLSPGIAAEYVINVHTDNTTSTLCVCHILASFICVSKPLQILPSFLKIQQVWSLLSMKGIYLQYNATIFQVTFRLRISVNCLKAVVNCTLSHC